MAAESPSYRPHLDGIRALAVAMVVVFHLGYEWIPGGFIGVDVFFVLSGYLITGILADEVGTHGGVRLRRFFARRVRRLLPASLAVLGVVLVLGRRWLDAVQHHDLGIDALWASLYSANWRFATEGGDYFAPGDVPSPLVHYWSLAVEEQFYLVWPLVVAAVAALSRRRGRSPVGPLLAATGVLGAASLAASVLTVGSPVAYYGTHTRAHQLLAGATVALVVRRLPHLDRSGSTATGYVRFVPVIAAVGSTALLLWLSHGISDASRYPGWPGAGVTVVSLALIASLDLAPAGLHTRVFGAGPLAALGRWSYSIYIWHWPVIVLAPVAAEELSTDAIARIPTMVAAMSILAGVSYLLVERPVRFRLLPSARPMAVVAVGLSCSLLMAATARTSTALDDREEQVLAATTDTTPAAPCPYARGQWEGAPQEPCVWRDGDGPTVALVGDSHAQHLLPALAELAGAEDARIVLATRMGCPAPDMTMFLVGEDRREVVDRECTRWRREVYPQVTDMADVVVLATRSYMFGIVDGDRHVDPEDPEHLRLWSEAWRWSIETLSADGARIVVPTMLPTMPEDVPACLIENGIGTDACDFALSSDVRLAPYNDAIRELPGRFDRVSVADIVPIVCPDGTCPAMVDGDVVHRDDNHLTSTFVTEHAERFASAAARGGTDLFGR